MQMTTQYHWGRLPHCAGASGGTLGRGCWKLCCTLVPREAAGGAEEAGAGRVMTLAGEVFSSAGVGLLGA